MSDAIDQLAVAPGLPAMPPKVAKAVSDVMAGIEKLGKDEKNPHANYKYAGIESFLEMVRPLCAKAGLIILQDEEFYEFRDAQDKYGKPLSWLVMSFLFGLAHSSGETWPHRIRRTGMVQASMGSQAFGAAQSYAMKSFLRSLELIATGDSEDADSHAQSELPKKSAHKARKEGDYPKLEAAIRAAQTEEDLRKFTINNQQVIAELPDSWQTHLREEYGRRLTEIREGVTEDGSPLKKQLKASLAAEDEPQEFRV
jgi:hypothetical protein